LSLVEDNSERVRIFSTEATLNCQVRPDSDDISNADGLHRRDKIRAAQRFQIDRRKIGQLVERRRVKYDAVLLAEVGADCAVDHFVDRCRGNGGGALQQQLQLVLQVVIPGIFRIAVDVDVEERDHEHEDQHHYDDLLHRQLR